MVIYDDIVNWMGTGQEDTALNNDENSCRIRIVKLAGTGGLSFLKKYYIIATDPGGNSGAALSSSEEVLIPLICATHNIDFHEMVWFEHYPGTDSEPTLEVVTPTPIKCSCPSACSQRVSLAWRPARKNEIEHLKQFIDIEFA